MTWHDDEGDEDEAELDEREHPGPEDADWNLDPAEIRCPWCKREMSEDSVRCPHCGSYISAEDAPVTRAWWWWAAVVLLIALIIAWVLRRA